MMHAHPVYVRKAVAIKWVIYRPFPIVSKQKIAEGIFDVVVACPEMAQLAKAGQFVHIRCPG